MVIEPYSPHRFSRQFGYHQDLPGTLKADYCSGSSKSIFRYSESLVRSGTKSALQLPNLYKTRSLSITKAYFEWWSSIYSEFFSTRPTTIVGSKRLASPDQNSAKAKKIALGSGSASLAKQVIHED